jgi:hypothetical protein
MTSARACSVAILLGALALFAAFDVTPVRAQSWASPYAWCAQWGGNWGGFRECSYQSHAQCMASVFGAGGGCYPNPAYVPPAYESRPARKHRRHAN